MNDILEFEIPRLLDDTSIYHFSDLNYDQWYGDFVNHWATHPCVPRQDSEGSGCMEAFILNGMQKVARPICTNKNKHVTTNEFPDSIYVGCGNTPKLKSGL